MAILVLLVGTTAGLLFASIPGHFGHRVATLAVAAGSTALAMDVLPGLLDAVWTSPMLPDSCGEPSLSPLICALIVLAFGLPRLAFPIHEP